MTRTALALSPHLDDAVFSCGGTLALLARAGWRVVVVTLFTRSVPNPQGFALACQLDKGLGPDVDYMALRRAEDRDAIERLGLAEAVHVPLPEAPHRGYDTASALFGPIGAGDDIAGPLATALADAIAAHAPALLLAPQAIGGHVDHVQLVRALGAPDLPTLWWRDFPYTIRDGTPSAPFEARFDTLPSRSVALPEAALTMKLAGCRAYASQLGYQFGGADALATALSRGGDRETFRGLPDPACML